jgi:peptidoglycan-associated lipoprotein
MKSAKLVSLLAVGLALALGGLGCRKNLDKVTNIPGQPPAQPRDGTAGMIGNTDPIDSTGARSNDGVTGAPGGRDPNLPASQIPFDDMERNREVFSADTIHFEFDKSTIRPSDVSKLEIIARLMKSDYAGKYLSVEGFCDDRGTEEYNRALGDRRALSAREYLARLGLSPEHIQTISYGEANPVDPGNNDAAWAKNRRCEFILLTPR